MPNHEQLLKKLGSTQLNLSPGVSDLMQRVREVGLHKIAAHIHEVPEFSLKTAAQFLGTQLIYQHYKFSKIASGIQALQALDQSGEITLEKTAMPPIPAAAMRGGRLSKVMLEASSGGKLFNPGMLRGGNQTVRGGGEAAKALEEAIALSGRKIPPPVPPGSSATMEAMQGLRQMPPPIPTAAGGGRVSMASFSALDFAKMANIFRLGAKGVKSAIPAAAKGSKALKTVAPGFFEGAVGASKQPTAAKSMFKAFNPEVMSASAKKQTIRGAQAPKLPAMHSLPSAPL